MESLSKQMLTTADFFIRSGCLLVMHLCAFGKIWSVVEHRVECYFDILSFSFSKITT